MQRLAVTLAGLLDWLCPALRSRSMAAASVTARLKPIGGGAHERTVRLRTLWVICERCSHWCGSTWGHIRWLERYVVVRLSA